MWIEVFKTGEHIASDGTKFSSTGEVINNITSLYNFKVDESDSNMAPLVLGHPKDNEPAIGWVERLGRRGEKLVAKLTNIAPEVVEQIKQGKFKKISISLYPDLMLRHIGLLGAASPAVKGLNSVKFNEYLNFLNYLEEDDNTDDDFVEFTQQIQLLQDENKLLNEKLNQQLFEQKRKEFVQYTEQLSNNTANQFITPANSQQLVELLELSYKSDSLLQNHEQNLTEKIQEFVSNLKPLNLMKEFTSNDFKSNLDFNSFVEKNTNPERLKLHDKAMKIISLTKELSYEDAVIKALKD